MTPLLTVSFDAGNTITVPNTIVSIVKTYLSRDISAAVTSLPVDNATGFPSAVTTVILLGEPGTELVERLVVSSVATSTITAGTSTKFAHSKGEPVYFISYNQIEISKSSTLGGSYSVVVTQDLDWTEIDTTYLHTAGLSTDYYKVRYLNSATTTYSVYSAETKANFGDTTVGAMVSGVRKSIGNITLDDDFFLTSLNDARGVLEKEFGYGKVYEWRQNFEYPIQMLAGTNFVTLPSTGTTAIEIGDTNRYLINVRYSRATVAANLPMQYLDKKRMNQFAYQNRFNTTSGITTSGATSLVLANTGDFPASGTVFIATEANTQSILTVTYTGNNLATNTLTGVAGITRTIATGIQVWAYSTFAYPYFYTVYSGKIWFDKPIPAALQGKNCYIDYYTKMQALVNLNDVIPEPYRDVYKDYLRFAVKRRRDDSIGEDDADYIRFIRGAKNIFGNPWTGQRVTIN